jgi:cytochrome b
LTNGTRPRTDPEKIESIKVWDVPTRVFHWLLVVSFAGAWLARGSETWRDVHEMFGYTVAMLIAFRVFWGFAGSYYARFSSFDLAPVRILSDLRGHFYGTVQRSVGHSPAGAAAILGLLSMAVIVVATGIIITGKLDDPWLGSIHVFVADAMLFFVAMHVSFVVWVSFRYRENLVRAMLTGRKIGRHRERIGRSRWAVGVVLFIGVIGYWSVDRFFALSSYYDGVAYQAVMAGSSVRSTGDTNRNQ